MKIFKWVTCGVLYVAGFGLLLSYAGWQVAAAVFLILWASNIERSL